MRKYTEEIKSYVLENVNSEGMFLKRYTDISHDLDIPMNAVRLAILDIAKSGFIEVLTAPTRGVNSNPVYKLKTNKVIPLDTHPIHDEVEVEFYGVKLHMFETEIGLVLPIEELAIATLSDTSIIYKIISANAIQFEGNTIEIDGVNFINKIGALLYLTKLNLSNSLPLKMEVLNRFQTDIILHMNEVILKGRLVFTEDNHIKIKSNLSLLTDITIDMVDSMFVGLESQIESMVGDVRLAEVKCKNTVEKLSRENSQLKSRIDTEIKAKERLITENRNYQGKLLDRS